MVQLIIGPGGQVTLPDDLLEHLEVSRGGGKIDLQKLPSGRIVLGPSPGANPRRASTRQRRL
jgi:hypothetical protein